MRRSSIVAGIILILVGLFFLALPLFPNIAGVINIADQWPLIVVAIGGFFLIGAFLGAHGLAVPGCIIAGIGGLLYYQNAFDAWESWAYAWTLIPGFVGVGVFISQALDGQARAGLRAGGGLVLISAALFLVFGSLLGTGISFGVAWALLLIIVGIWMMARALRRVGRKGSPPEKEQDQKSEW